MTAPIRNYEDLAAGLSVAAIGMGAAAVAGENYTVGTAERMGSGYMPVLLGIVLTLLGLSIAIRGLKTQLVDRVAVRAALRPIGLVLGAVLLFGLLINLVGVIVTTIVTIIGASLGSRDAHLLETGALALVMAVAAPLVFVTLLGLPLKIWPL